MSLLSYLPRQLYLTFPLYSSIESYKVGYRTYSIAGTTFFCARLRLVTRTLSAPTRQTQPHKSPIESTCYCTFRGGDRSRSGSLPEWGKDDRATRVIRVAIYAKSRRPLFVLFDQIRCMHGVRGFPRVIAWGIAFPPDQELELLVPAEVPVTAD